MSAKRPRSQPSKRSDQRDWHAEYSKETSIRLRLAGRRMPEFPAHTPFNKCCHLRVHLDSKVPSEIMCHILRIIRQLWHNRQAATGRRQFQCRTSTSAWKRHTLKSSVLCALPHCENQEELSLRSAEDAKYEDIEFVYRLTTARIFTLISTACTTVPTDTEAERDADSSSRRPVNCLVLCQIKTPGRPQPVSRHLHSGLYRRGVSHSRNRSRDLHITDWIRQIANR